MPRLEALYLIISGAGTARRTPQLLEALTGIAPRTLTLLTGNALRVVSPRELALVPGHTVVESYFDEAILPQPPPGLVLIAPCTFNSLNKLVAGIADNLALSVASEAIGRGTPVVVALSLNLPLWEHPRARQSAEILRSWGVTVIEPAVEDGRATMAADELIVKKVRAVWEAYGGTS